MSFCCLFFPFFISAIITLITLTKTKLKCLKTKIQPMAPLHHHHPHPPKQCPAHTPRTHQPEPSGAPQDVRCHSSSSTNILVSWLPPPTELQNGIIVQYTVQYAATEGEDTAPRQISDIPPGSSQYLLENLDKFTEYRVSVTAHTDVGAGPESPPQLVRTEEDGMCLLKRRRELTSRTLSSLPPPACC